MCVYSEAGYKVHAVCMLIFLDMALSQNGLKNTVMEHSYLMAVT